MTALEGHAMTSHTHFPKAKHSRMTSCPTRAVVSRKVTFRSAGYFLMGPEERKHSRVYYPVSVLECKARSNA